MFTISEKFSCIATPENTKIEVWPLVIDVEENWYFKPEAGKVLASPGDATPDEPKDVQPEELDVATIAGIIERNTTMKVGRISHRRAGLRTFSPDNTPVVGFGGEKDGFFWLVGQGGYGIETSPAMSVAAASLITNRKLPPEFIESGISEADLDPTRFD